LGKWLAIVLVCGGTGFIGRNLCQALAALGGDVTGLSMSGTGSGMTGGVCQRVVDLRRLEDVKAEVARVRPGLIFHLAGLVTARRDRDLVLPMFETNATGTVHLLLAASEVPCERLVLVGTAEASGWDGQVGPSSPYAASKHVAEIYGQMFYRLYELPVVGVRPFLTYGPWQEPSKLIPYTIRMLLRSEALFLTSGERVCDAVYVEDVVRGLLKAAVASSEVLGLCMDLGTGKGVSIRELVEAVAKLMGSRQSLAFGGLPDRACEEDAVADAKRSKSLLGWEPYWSLDDGLRTTVGWYRQHLEWGKTL
jgi:nucleoside-diphosphate-sugar epimerase